MVRKFSLPTHDSLCHFEPSTSYCLLWNIMVIVVKKCDHLDHSKPMKPLVISVLAGDYSFADMSNKRMMGLSKYL